MAEDVSNRLAQAERRLDGHDKRIDELETDMTEIRTYLGQAATKEDIAGLRTYIDGAINGLLRNALNSIPAWLAGGFGAVAFLFGLLAILHEYGLL